MICKSLYTDSCFTVLDTANFSSTVKIKEALQVYQFASFRPGIVSPHLVSSKSLRTNQTKAVYVDNAKTIVTDYTVRLY